MAEGFTGRAGKYVPLKDTIRSFKEVISGNLDHLPEQAFYMCGGLDDLLEAAKKLGYEVGA